MENILVVGVNTRSLACSLNRIGYKVFSADYFGVIDIQECVYRYKSVLSQISYISCGFFTDQFKSSVIEDLAANYVDECDSVICLAGVSPEKFPKKKIMGNKFVKKVDNKYSLYKKLKNQFKIPKTYLLSDGQEASEIARNYPDKIFLLKPVKGSGGYGIREINRLDMDKGLSNNLYTEFSNFILQEKLDGIDISASVLSTGSESKTILISQQIIGNSRLGQKEPYGYCGNITPLTDNKGAAGKAEASKVAEEIINQLGLVGSNGVDFILMDNDLYVIEVNPRIQGTMECAELVLDINMAEAHIKACQGDLIDVNPPRGYAVKMIVHALERSKVGKIDFKYVYDLPAENVVIEGGEPVATVITSGKDLNNTLNSAGEIVKKVYNNLETF